MRSTFNTRLERLEAQSRKARQSMTQIGLLKRLPDDFFGERHIEVVKRDPSSAPNWQMCEFEERPGPAPPGTDDSVCRVFFTEDEMLA